MVDWVCLDVGETLVDESRVWATWAEALGVPPLTFGASAGQRSPLVAAASSAVRG